MFGLLFLFVLFLSFAPDFKIQALEPRTNVVILSIGYIPRDPVNTDYVNRSETGTDIPLNTKVIDVSNKINYLTTQGMSILTDSSRYKGYRESSPAAVSYQLVEPTRFVYQPLPRGMLLSGNTYRPDYRTILTNLDICRYVDQLGVNQVWLWGYHSPTLVPVESNMSMGETSRAFFNRGSFGDVSNSERTDDLPRCQSTYVLYNYNYGREIGEVLENHTHQLEAVLRYANTFNEPKDPVGSALFWNNFVGATNTSPSITKPGCGWTHYPPNGRSDYDWYNTTPVMSDCEDWLPGGGGTTKSISCQTWSKTNACPDDGGVSFKRWWMQNLPGLNNGLTHNGKPLKNWWLFVSDFDYAMKVGGGLLVTQASPSPSPSPTPTPTPSPTSTPTATPTPVPSRLDINNDGKVDIFDYSMLISEYGKTTATRSDINDDGIVNMIDITIFLEGFPRLS